MPPALGIALGRAIGFALRDVILTRAELQGLMEDLLTSPQAPNGTTRFTDWILQQKGTVGVRYASELGRRFRRRPSPVHERLRPRREKPPAEWYSGGWPRF